jgi:hypothetical protein
MDLATRRLKWQFKVHPKARRAPKITRSLFGHGYFGAGHYALKEIKRQLGTVIGPMGTL